MKSLNDFFQPVKSRRVNKRDIAHPYDHIFRESISIKESILKLLSSSEKQGTVDFVDQYLFLVYPGGRFKYPIFLSSAQHDIFLPNTQRIAHSLHKEKT